MENKSQHDNVQKKMEPWKVHFHRHESWCFCRVCQCQTQKQYIFPYLVKGINVNSLYFLPSLRSVSNIPHASWQTTPGLNIHDVTLSGAFVLHQIKNWSLFPILSTLTLILKWISHHNAMSHYYKSEQKLTKFGLIVIRKYKWCLQRPWKSEAMC